MTNIVLILDENGEFDNLLSDTEIKFKILKRGEDDNEIDVAEANFEPVEEN